MLLSATHTHYTHTHKRVHTGGRMHMHTHTHTHTPTNANETSIQLFQSNKPFVCRLGTRCGATEMAWLTWKTGTWTALFLLVSIQSPHTPTQFFPVAQMTLFM